jgi:hypothetical protein
LGGGLAAFSSPAAESTFQASSLGKLPADVLLVVADFQAESPSAPKSISSISFTFPMTGWFTNGLRGVEDEGVTLGLGRLRLSGVETFVGLSGWG